MKHKVITCASFGSSGSGVITDYLKEFDNIFNPGDYEFRFLQDFGGITTLEDSIVYNHHRLNSDIAIQIFIKYMKYQCGDIFNRRYNKYFKGQFGEITEKFLKKIIELKWDGYWEEYQVLSPQYKTIFKYKIYPRILRLLNGNKNYIARYVPRENMYFSNPSEEYFTQCVREYLEDLFDVVDNSSQYDYLYFDQLFPPTNIDRYFKFFYDIHVVVVDRDPRDYYVENVIKNGEGWVPQNIDKFIHLYKSIRKKIDINNENNNILRLRFEDTIFHYEDICEIVNKFLNLKKDNHIYKQKYFNPNKSINNTQLWKKIKVPTQIIDTIEKELGEYCYNFK